MTDELERAFGDFSLGRFAWELTNVRALATPIPCKGMLGLWTPPEDALAKLTSYIAEEAANAVH